MDALFLIDKPAGESSARAIVAVKKKLPRGTKVGHAGTLDPFATGLLVVLTGKATRLSDLFLKGDKTYEGTIRFGQKTSTADIEGEITETSRPPESLERIQAAAKTFEHAEYLQLPPMHSAVKIQGKKLYELARKGIEVERAPRRCRIDAFNVLDYQGTDARFRVKCGSGTYVRALAEDLASRLGTTAHLATLRRIASAPFELSRTADTAVIPMDAALDFWPNERKRECDASLLSRVKSGDARALGHFRKPDASLADSPHALYCEGKLIALLEWKPSGWGFSKVLLA